MEPMSRGAKRRFRIRLEADLARDNLALVPPDPNTPAEPLAEWRAMATQDEAQIRAWGAQGAFAHGFGVFYPDGELLGFVVGSDEPAAATPAAWLAGRGK